MADPRDDPTLRADVLLARLDPPVAGERLGAGFWPTHRALGAWFGRHVIAFFMIPVGVALGAFGIVEEALRRRSRSRT